MTSLGTRLPGRWLLAAALALAITIAGALQFAGVSPLFGATGKKPVVKIIATGGTIANTPDGRISVEQIIAELPEVTDIADLRVEDVTRLGSSSLTYKEFIDTARAVNRTFAEEPDVDGIVVTVGSNASEDLAYFLNLLVKSDKPVVVTAAQRQRTTRSEDSSRNFIDSLVTVTTPEAKGKGVMLVVNETIHAGRDATKSVFSRVDSWESPDVGALGLVSGGKAVFYREPLRRHTTGSEFSLDGIDGPEDLPGVEIIYSYIDASPALITAAVEEADAKGLVVAAFPTASAHIGQRPALQAATEKGIAVVIGNRGMEGLVSPRTLPFIGSDTLTPQKSAILLKLALTKTSDPVELQRIFSEY